MVFRKMLAALFVIGGSLLFWCEASAQQTGWQQERNTGDRYYLRLSGSNTIGSALAPSLVKSWLMQQGAKEINVVQRAEPDGSLKDEWEVRASRGGTPIVVEIKFHGSRTGFLDLAAGTTDVAMASRRVLPAEADTLGGLRAITSVASEHVIGLDGVSIIVPRTNNVLFLSTQVLEDIFCGRTRNWSALGGANLPITLYARDDKSGTYDTFKALVLKTCPLDRGAHRYEDSTQLEFDVSQDAGGIGFVAFPYVKNTHAVPISDGDAEPLEPTRFTIKKEDYALSRRLYLYVPGIPANPHALEFIKFALSDAGQEIVRTNDFVDLIIPPHLDSSHTDQRGSKDCRLSPQWTGDPLQYCKLKKQNLLTVVYFDTGSSDLDNRAKRDMRRSFVAIDANPNSTVVLAGFADSRGDYAANCTLSLRRADSIGKEFRRLGIDASRSVGFCQEQPVRSNASEEGLEKNRRVEVYLSDPGFDPGPQLPQMGRLARKGQQPAAPAGKRKQGKTVREAGASVSIPPVQRSKPGEACNYFKQYTVQCAPAAH